MINTFYISKSTHPYSLFYIYDERGMLEISYTLNLSNNTIYTQDKWTKLILTQHFIFEYGDARIFIKT